MKRADNAYVQKTRWSRPMSIKELAHIFDVHRNTMAEWLKKQTISNRHLSPRRWEVASFELPYEDTKDDIAAM